MRLQRFSHLWNADDHFIDIHEIGGASPNDFNVLITDIDDRTLRSEAAELIGILYLKKTTKVEANNKVDVSHGFIYGDKLRTLFPCIVGSRDWAHWGFFMVHTDAPLTYLLVQVSAPTNLRRNTWLLT